MLINKILKKCKSRIHFLFVFPSYIDNALVTNDPDWKFFRVLLLCRLEQSFNLLWLVKEKYFESSWSFIKLFSKGIVEWFLLFCLGTNIFWNFRQLFSLTAAFCHVRGWSFCCCSRSTWSTWRMARSWRHFKFCAVSSRRWNTIQNEFMFLVGKEVGS